MEPLLGWEGKGGHNSFPSSEKSKHVFTNVELLPKEWCWDSILWILILAIEFMPGYACYTAGIHAKHPLCYIGPHSTVTVRIVRTFEGHRIIANFNSSKSTVFIFLLKKHDQRRAFYCLIGSCDLFALLSSPLDELCTCVDTLSSDTFLQKNSMPPSALRILIALRLESREGNGYKGDFILVLKVYGSQ